jgi:hypothetical protein
MASFNTIQVKRRLKMKMRHMIILIVITALYLIFSATSYAASPPPGNLVVTVKNKGGSTFSGAIVKRYNPSGENYIDQKFTDLNGNATWSSITEGVYYLKACYQGMFFGEEFWASDTTSVGMNITTNKVLQRNYPYMESISWYLEIIIDRNDSNGELLKPGIAGNDFNQIQPGTTVLAEITVRNCLSTSQNVQVRVILDRDQSGPYDLDQTSSEQTILYGGTQTFVLAFTPTELGQWYRAFQVITKLGNGTKVTSDAGDWELGWIVEQPTGNLVVNVKNISGNAPPNTIVKRYNESGSYIDQKVADGSGKVTWNSLPHGIYNLSASYSGTFFGEEFWANDSTFVSEGITTNKILQRNYPFILYSACYDSATGASIRPSDQIEIGTPVRAQIAVKNSVSASLVVKVRLLLDQSQSSPFDSDQTSSEQTIPYNGIGLFWFTFTPTQAGSWYRTFEVKTQLPDRTIVTTDAWGWNQAFTVRQQQTGTLCVSISPQGAIDAGARWRRIGTSTWYNSGYTETDIPNGQCVVEFKDIPGWGKPSNQNGTITNSQTLAISGIYSNNTAVNQVPKTFNVWPPFPNPLNPTTTIRYEIPSECHVSLILYDINGRRVSVLEEGVRSAGIYEAMWDGKDKNNIFTASGVYLYRLKAGANVNTGKILFLR